MSATSQPSLHPLCPHSDLIVLGFTLHASLASLSIQFQIHEGVVPALGLGTSSFSEHNSAVYATEEDQEDQIGRCD